MASEKSERVRNVKLRRAATFSFIGCALVLACGSARASEEDAASRRSSARVYLWIPSCSAETRFPPSDGGIGATVDASNFDTSLNSVFMGSFETRKRRWGVLSDVVYLDIQKDASAAGQFELSGPDGAIQIPIDAGADATLRIHGWDALLAAGYTAVETSRYELTLLGGVRWLMLDMGFTWRLDVTAGSVPPQAMSGDVTVTSNYLDAVVGVRGRVRLGQGRWFAPYHLDIGAGGSDLTWQVAGGFGRAFKWGEIVALYRNLDYQLPASTAVRRLTLGGPQVAVALTW